MVGPDLKTWISIVSVTLALSSLAVMTGAKLRDQETNTDNIDKLYQITERNAESISRLESAIKNQATIQEYQKQAIDKNTLMIERLN